MKFDDILLHLGEFGIYQKRVYLLLCFICITHGLRMVTLVFLMNLPSHRCAIPGYANDSFEVNSLAHQVAFNKSIPAQDSCHVYKGDNYTYDDYNQPINASLEKCDRWVYDTSVFTLTGATQFDLVCDDAMKRSHASMTFYGGFLIGVIVLGAVSDRIGRKLCLYLSLSLLIAFGTGLAFAPSLIAFAIINFFLGAATTGIFTSSLIIGIELVGPSKRMYTGMVIHMFCSTGTCLLAGVAYLVRDWRYLEVVVTLPSVVFYLMWCFIPESPRWQIQRGKFTKARKTVMHAAKVNKTHVPTSILNEIIPERDEDEVKAEESSCRALKDQNATTEKKGNLFDLFKSRVLFIRTSILFYNWVAVSLTFYGLHFNTANLGAGSIFLNFFLAGLVEYPAHITNIFTVSRLGRKKVHSGMLTVSGVSCLVCVLVIMHGPSDSQWLVVALAMLGKFGAAGSYGTIYLYSMELYPTVIRSTALGASSSFARVGTMLAPYVAALGAKSGGTFGRGLPLLICGCLALVAACVSIFLPETLNRKLPETIMDAENFTRNSPEEFVVADPKSSKEEQQVKCLKVNENDIDSSKV